MNLQPYQQAGQKLRKQGELPYEVAKTATSIAAGGNIAARILPLLTQFLPDDLRQKALSKVDSRIGNFVSQANDYGFDQNQIMNFLKDKFSESKEPEATQEPEKIQEPETKNNPIADFETNYPQLAQALMNTIQYGQTPQAAAAILKQSTIFGKQVKKLEKELGKNFVDYVLELFGTQSEGMHEQAPPAQQQQAIPQAQGNGPQQSSNIDQELMAALDKILKM